MIRWILALSLAASPVLAQTNGNGRPTPGVPAPLTACGPGLSGIAPNCFVSPPPAPVVTTFAGLPSAASAGAGVRSFITDATATTFGSVAAGGGSNKMPVVSDGSSWIIG